MQANLLLHVTPILQNIDCAAAQNFLFFILKKYFFNAKSWKWYIKSY